MNRKAARASRESALTTPPTRSNDAVRAYHGAANKDANARVASAAKNVATIKAVAATRAPSNGLRSKTSVSTPPWEQGAATFKAVRGSCAPLGTRVERAKTFLADFAKEMTPNEMAALNSCGAFNAFFPVHALNEHIDDEQLQQIYDAEVR